MKNKRTILEYLDSLNEDSKSKKKETSKISKSNTSKCIDISEINKLFDTFTLDIKKLNKRVRELYNSSTIRYIEGEINALEYSRNMVSHIIESHLK